MLNITQIKYLAVQSEPKSKLSILGSREKSRDSHTR